MDLILPIDFDPKLSYAEVELLEMSQDNSIVVPEILRKVKSALRKRGFLSRISLDSHIRLEVYDKC